MRQVKFVSVFVLLVLLLSTTLAMGQNSISTIRIEDLVQEVLRDYSTSLATGRIVQDASYSQAMIDLLEERRDFYAEFFLVGLHSDLLNIESRFTVESIARNDDEEDLYNIQAVETVTLRGKYKCSSPDEYPLVKSGRWALARAEHVAVRTAVEGYIQSMVDGVEQAIQEGGFEIIFIVRHDLVMRNDAQGLRVVRNSFTDSANDNTEGYDNVSWVRATFIRHKPDLTNMPDYIMYRVTTEELGKGLLNTYSEMFNTKTPSSFIQSTYNRTAAAGYALTWVAPTQSTCAPNVFQNMNNWNPAYHKISCNDCANFVSQALKRGGHTTTGTWYPSSSSADWNYVPNLKSFLLNSLRGYGTGDKLNLQVGDLAFQNLGHVVMVTSVAPHRYSAHTSDRENATWYSGLNYYMIICSEICPN